MHSINQSSNITKTVRNTIKSMHATEGVNFENPSDIFAKLLAVIPQVIAIAKKIYPVNGFILVSFSK